MKCLYLAILVGSFLGGCAQAETTEKSAAELRAVIAKANEAFILAVRSGDADQLSPYFSGKALEPLSLSVKRARAGNRYSVSELQDIRWGRVQVQDEQAEVETSEKWQHTHYEMGTDKCIYMVPARVVRQTYYLRSTSRGWVITQLVDDPKNEAAQVVACQ